MTTFSTYVPSAIATIASGCAAATPSVIVFQGLDDEPSLAPVKLASTYWVVGSTGMFPQVPTPHGAISRHAVSPSDAIVPKGQLSAGRMGSHTSTPGAKPSGHASSGTPAGRHVPSASSISPGAHPAGGGVTGGGSLGSAAQPKMHAAQRAPTARHAIDE